MGSQVNFYWCGSDESQFMDVVRERSGDLCLLRYTSPTETFEPRKDLPLIGEPFGSHVWLWDRSICKSPVVQWVEEQSYFTIDPSQSEVIELWRPYEREGRLIRGRLWGELTGWRKESPSETFEKSPAFRKWFNSLASWIKRHYTRTPDGWYAGPEAKAFQQRGGRLIQVDFAPVVKLVRH